MCLSPTASELAALLGNRGGVLETHPFVVSHGTIARTWLSDDRLAEFACTHTQAQHRVHRHVEQRTAAAMNQHKKWRLREIDPACERRLRVSEQCANLQTKYFQWKDPPSRRQ